MTTLLTGSRTYPRRRRTTTATTTAKAAAAGGAEEGAGGRARRRAACAQDGPPSAARARGPRPGRHPVFDLAGHLLEGLLDIVRVLGAGLQVLDLERVRQLLRLVEGHDPLGGQVALVPDEQLVHVIRGVLIDLLHPVLDVVEGLLVRHIIHNNDAVETREEAARDRAEPLLARPVPDLQLADLAIQLERADFEVHTDGADVALCVGVVSEAKQQARFADTRVA